MENKIKPKIKAVLVLLLILPIGLLLNFSQINNQLYSSVLPTIIVNLSNQTRQEADVPALHTNTKLQKAAQLKAQEIATLSGLQGTHSDTQSWYWLDQVGYNYAAAGENVAIDLDNSADSGVDWLNSSEQQQNILNRNYTETGIGQARGTYQGKEVSFIVQYFGKPSPLRENPLTLARADR